MINRDGQRTSLWQDAIAPYETINDINGQKQFDIIIVGGGITGISTALLLQQAGKKCLVIEAANLCFGTTGGTTAHLNTLLDTPYTTIQKNFDKDTSQKVATLTANAIKLIQYNSNNNNIDCSFEPADAYLFAQDEQQEKELEKIAEASANAGLTLEYSPAIPVPMSFRKAIRVQGQAKFNPVDYVYGIAAAFEKAGGIILQQCRVTDVDNTDPIQVTTIQGLFTATDLIYATHIPPGVNLLHLRCMPYRSYAMAVTLENESYPTDLSYDMEDPYHYYRTQEVNGQKYLIAGGKDHKTGTEPNTDHRFEELEAHVRKYFPVKEVAYKWSSQYFEPADGLPYIGHLPGSPGHIYVACGYGGNGMVYSHVAAMLLKSLIIKEETDYNNLFNPNRIKPVAGFVNFIKHNAAVVKEFAGKIFPFDEIDVLAELAPGEGRLVAYENKKLALYKDEQGKLYALSPVCTHLKCEVKWNQAERSWDCPCHGTRYNYDGTLVTGPASSDLEVINLQQLVEK